MKNSVKIFLAVAAVTLSATSCFEHKELGDYVAYFGQDIKLNYTWEDPNAGPVINSASATLPYCVFAYPSGEERIYPVDAEITKTHGDGESCTIKRKECIDNEDNIHFQGNYDFLVSSIPFYKHPDKFTNESPKLKDLEIVAPDKIDLSKFDVINPDLLPAAAKNGRDFCAYAKPCSTFVYGVLKDELIPGSFEDTPDLVFPIENKVYIGEGNYRYTITLTPMVAESDPGNPDMKITPICVIVTNIAVTRNLYTGENLTFWNIEKELTPDWTAESYCYGIDRKNPPVLFGFFKGEREGKEYYCYYNAGQADFTEANHAKESQSRNLYTYMTDAFVPFITIHASNIATWKSSTADAPIWNEVDYWGLQQDQIEHNLLD